MIQRSQKWLITMKKFNDFRNRSWFTLGPKTHEEVKGELEKIYPSWTITNVCTFDNGSYENENRADAQ